MKLIVSYKEKSMKTFIIPTDFSDTSKNAARYAAQLANEIEDAKIILYNVYDTISIGTDGTPLHIDNDTRHQIMLMALNNMSLDLQNITSATIECIAEEGIGLIETIEAFAKKNNADLIIMGITGASRMDQIFMGSNAIKMVHHASCPVIIVPPAAKYSKVEHVMLLSNFKNEINTAPLKNLKKALTLFNPSLHVVDIDNEYNPEITDDYKKEVTGIFQDYKPQFHFIKLHNFTDGIQTFCEENPIELIVTVPKKHGMLSRVFSPSHTERLAYHNTIPILALANE